MNVQFKNFLREYERGSDAVQAFIPCETLQKFVDADISSQALINASVVLVNDDRTDVTLSQ